MSIVLLATMLWIQAQPGSGSLTGEVRDAKGTPVEGVRVALEEVNDVGPGSVLISIGKTDAEGLYRMQNIPVGRYRLVAGRVDMPTYYPGTLARPSATVVEISAASAVTGMNFVVAAESLQIPVRIGQTIAYSGFSPTNLQPFSFAYEGLAGQTLLFTRRGSGELFSYVCRECTFQVWLDGIGASPPVGRVGVLFHLRTGNLEFTCQSTECRIQRDASKPEVLKKDEAGSIPASPRTTFSVTP